MSADDVWQARLSTAATSSGPADLHRGLGRDPARRRSRRADPEQSRAVEVIGRNAQRLQAQVAELGSTGALPSGPPAPGDGVVDVAAVVGAAIDLVRPTARLGGIVLDERPAGRRLTVLGDTLRLEGAVVNVVGTP